MNIYISPIDMKMMLAMTMFLLTIGFLLCIGVDSWDD